MGTRLKMLLLLCLMAASAFTAGEAWKTLKVEKGKGLPEEVYAKMLENSENAEFYLRNNEGFVAVYKGKREKNPVTVTGIEVSLLRRADRAMLELGIPVADSRELLTLLEDLGS